MKRLSRLWVYDLPGIVVGILGLEREKKRPGLDGKGIGIRSGLFQRKKGTPVRLLQRIVK